MSTYMAKASEVSRKWYVIDAAGKPLGRVAAQAAHLLRGKHKPTFTPHVDCGDHVIIINCKDAVLTGNKLQQKSYQWHTGWIGGLKTIKYDALMKTHPEKAMSLAVEGMLPHNTQGRNAARRLRVYAGAEHTHAAQSPETYEL
ncbi:MAG: 50S ribosomal protein L13 [Massilioclostridium sp.]|jgi:large subunit ribosomal protein L13|nr:50S ribosomal protein L13 [Massilioclostridium sp.]MEE1491268.1 50S ribosomal protein L13 [Massilioclostridium sp.]